MKSFAPAVAAYLEARAGIVSHRLFWVRAKNRATGLFEEIGIWSGADEWTFQIGGQARSYTGAGAMLDADPVTSGQGLAVRTYQIRLSGVAPEVEDLVKGYETRGAVVEVHRALFDPAAHRLISAPDRVFLGRIDTIEFPDGAPGDAPIAQINLVSETRTLTRALGTLKSQAAQAGRQDDQFRRYADISGSVPVFWGEKRES